MAKVIIRHNDSYSFDTVQVVYEDGTTHRIDRSQMDPRRLEDVLQKLGFEIEVVDHKFDHDED